VILVFFIWKWIKGKKGTFTRYVPPSEQNLKVCRRDEKVWRPDGQTNERTAEVLYTPIFFWRRYTNPIKN
jgi:hypothetical protein